MFGFRDNPALNQILLELKKEIFYSFDPNVDVTAFLESFVDKIRKLIIKEKNCAITPKMMDQFSTKWENFTSIYDFRGPDLSIV